MAYAEVILTENIPTLGAEADIVKVRRGFARNFLIPEGKALEVTPSSLRKINHLKAKRAEREAHELAAAEELSNKVKKLHLKFDLATGETGKAFGAVTAKDIMDRLSDELKGAELPKHAVVLDKPIKESGSHQVEVKLHPDVVTKLKVTIEAPLAEGEEAPKAKKKKSAKSEE